MHTIAIVDDETGFITSMYANFRHEYHVISADNGKDGLTILKQQQVDLCILDHILPNMNGDEVLINIRQVKPHLPIIFLTANPSVELKTKVTRPEYRANVFLHKPVQPDYLAGIINELLVPEHQSPNKDVVAFSKGAKSQHHCREGKILRRQRLIEMVRLIENEPEKWTLGKFSVKYGCSKMQIHRDINELKKVETTLNLTKNGYKIDNVKKP